MGYKRYAMISEWMDNGNINEFVKAHKNVNRFELLEDVARGLNYLHDQEMIHGDLKGVNVFVDQTFHARLADFGLLNFAADPTDPTSSTLNTSIHGTTRWMSPELIHPEDFGFEDSRPTKESDCYALGMVILEVLSGKPPFADQRDNVVIQKIIRGGHPERPKEVWSTSIWRTMEQCWSPRPEMRPTAEDILDRLGRISREPTVWREDQNNAATVGGSGVSSSYRTAVSHRENFAGIPDRSPTISLEQVSLASADFRSKNNRETFPGVTVQPGGYESSATNSADPLSYDKRQTASPLQRVGPNILPPSRGPLMVTSNCIETLLRLDGSSPRFPDKLADILARREFGESIQSLERNDLVPLIEYLDKALDNLPTTGSAFERTHRKLQRVCVSRMLLPSSHTLSNDNLTIDERPFTSGYSETHKGRYNSREVCIKKLRVASASELDKTKKMIFREALIWKRLMHPNIVPFVGVTADPLQIASELMPHGNLMNYVDSNPQQDLVSLLVGVAKGLDYLHSHGVVHGDLKGRNVLVDASGNARITGFHLAQHTSRVVSMAEFQNMQWTEPEALVETEAPSTEADVFSFGIVMIETFTGAVPFSGRTALAAITALEGGKHPSRPTHPSLTDGLWELMNQCWDKDRHNRPRILEVLLAFTPFVHERTRPGGSPPATAGVQALISDIKRRLKNPDPSNEEYRPLLCALLSHRDLGSHIDRLQKGDLQGFIELLNEALDHIPVTDDLFRKTLCRLQSMCSDHETLPQAYVLPGGTLSNRAVPFASGRSTDAHEAKFYGKKVCVKALRRKIQSKSIYRGVVVWKRLKHPNIVPFIGVLISVPPLGIIHDWMDNGTITEYAKKHTQLDPTGLLWDLVEGLHYLHLCDTIHGNLKGVNVLVDKDGHARLMDFGLTPIFLGNKSVVGSQGDHLATVTMWTAPEISEGGAMTKEGDIFMFAMVAVEAFTEHSLTMECYAAVSTGQHPQQLVRLSSDLWDLMKGCWAQDPQKRLTTFELVDFFRPSILRE